MKQSLILSVALAAILTSTTVASAKQKSDHALLNEPGGDTSVQCGSKKGEGRPSSFVYYVTMRNVAISDGFIRVTYADTDFVEYPIPAGGAFSFSQAAGGTKNVDDLITITGTGGATLVGALSALFDEGSQPHPTLAPDFCTTTTGP